MGVGRAEPSNELIKIYSPEKLEGVANSCILLLVVK
jgi:hypothetical protein